MVARGHLVVGLLLAAVGLTGIVVRIIDSSSVSREEFIETMLSAPRNTKTRGELSCYFDMYERAGVSLSSSTEDEVAARFVDAFAQMSEAERESFTACIGQRTAAERQTQLDAMGDSQIRELLIHSMTTDPMVGLSRRDAECIVDYLDRQGVTRAMLLAEGAVSPKLAAVLDAAVAACS